jgi:hypothetical protein
MLWPFAVLSVIWLGPCNAVGGGVHTSAKAIKVDAATVQVSDGHGRDDQLGHRLLAAVTEAMSIRMQA